MRHLLAATLTVLSFSSTALSDPYRIGAILPLTGEAASVGMYAKHAAELALSDMPEEQRKNIEIIFDDDSMEPKKAVGVYERLKSANHIDAAIMMTSGIGHAVAPLAERDKTLLMVAGASDKSLATGKEYVFIHWVSPEAESKVMVDEIKKRGYKRIAMISNIQQGVTAFNDAFLKEMAAQKLEQTIVLNESIPIGNNDFNSILTKVRSSKPDAIYLALFSGGLATCSQKIKELKLPGDMFGAEFFEDSHIVEASKGALIGSWYVNTDDASKEYLTGYQTRFHEQPGLASANVYDSVRLIAQLVTAVGKDNQKIAQGLKTLTDYHGAAGVYSATHDNRFTLPAAVKRVTANGFEKLN